MASTPENKGCLEWKEHEDKQRKYFEELMRDLVSTDVTVLSADCKPIVAHQSVLIAKSPKIKDILISQLVPQKNGYLRLHDVNYEQLKIIIELMYTNKCTLPGQFTSEDVDNLKIVLRKYGLEAEGQTTF